MIDCGLISVDIDGVYVSPVMWDALPTVEAKSTFIIFAGVYRACVWWACHSREGRPLATTSVDVFSKQSRRKIADFDCHAGIPILLAPKQASRVRSASFGCASCHRADLAASMGLFCRLAKV